VDSVTSVKVDPAQAFGSDTVVDASTYVVHSERGVIQSKFGPFVPVPRNPGLSNQDRAIWTRSPRSVQVVYATATSAVPNDVKQAYALLVGHWYREVKTQVATDFQDIEAQKLGDTEVSYRRDRLEKLSVPAEIADLLAAFRTANV
jgi:hypothetical protein